MVHTDWKTTRASGALRPIASQPGGAVDAWLIEDRDGIRHWLGQHAGDTKAGVSRIVHPAA